MVQAIWQALAHERISDARACSFDGSIIVGSFQRADGKIVPGRWTEQGGFEDLGLLPGAGSGVATACNFDGSIVVGYCVLGASNFKAFIWTRETGIQELPKLYARDIANAVSDDGRIIVGESQGPGAAIWIDRTPYFLQDYLVSQRVSGLEGWQLLSATAITPDGSKVVGYGLNPDGQAEAFEVVIAVEMRPQSYQVTRGVQQMGGLWSLQYSDDTPLVIQQRYPFAVSLANAELTLQTSTFYRTPKRLQVRVEAKTSGVPLDRMNQKIEMYDYALNKWMLADERLPKGTDQVTVVDSPGPAKEFIHPLTGQVQARVRLFDRGVASLGWTASIDEVRWAVTP